jgi:hypothetical protein
MGIEEEITRTNGQIGEEETERGHQFRKATERDSEEEPFNLYAFRRYVMEFLLNGVRAYANRTRRIQKGARSDSVRVQSDRRSVYEFVPLVENTGYVDLAIYRGIDLAGLFFEKIGYITEEGGVLEIQPVLTQLMSPESCLRGYISGLKGRYPISNKSLYEILEPIEETPERLSGRHANLTSKFRSS